MYPKTFRLTKADLDRAFDTRRFIVLFQPQVSLETGEVIAAEAFVRWDHPTFGLMAPGLFFEFVEQQGRHGQLTAYVLGEALRTARSWEMIGRNWRVSVNVSGADIGSPDFVDVVAAELAKTSLSPDRLIIEAPEAALASGDPRLVATLAHLRDLGCGVALDSGGALPLDAAEFSPCPFTEIKIGGSAIIRFARHVQKASVGRISRRLAFARRNKLAAVAVGVEDEATLDALKKIGFSAVQGAYVQRPVAAADLDHWDGNWRRESMPAPLPPRPLHRPAPQSGVAEQDVGRDHGDPRSLDELDAMVAAAPKDRLIDTIPVVAPANQDGWDDEDEFDAPPAKVSPARDSRAVAHAADHAAEDDFVDPVEDLPQEDAEMRGADRAPPLTSAMIDRPPRVTAAPGELIQRKIRGIDRPINMQITEPTKKSGILGTGLDKIFTR